MTQKRYFLGVRESATGLAWEHRLNERQEQMALAMAQAVVPVMRRAPGTPRTLLFTGGGTADFPMRASLALGLEKAALRNLALGLDAELREEGIHVATLTVYGIVAPETPFAPTAIADAMAELIDESESASEHWTTVGEFRGR